MHNNFKKANNLPNNGTKWLGNEWMTINGGTIYLADPEKVSKERMGKLRGWSNELDLCVLSCISRHRENNHEKLGSVRSVEITSVALAGVIFKGQEWSSHTQCSNQIAAFLGNAVPLKCLLKPLFSKTNMLALSSEPTVIRCKQLKQLRR